MSHRRPAKPTLLIADHPVTRLGVRIALKRTASVRAEAGDADAAIVGAGREQPDICLIGFGLPGGGLHAIRGICAVAPEAAVVVLAITPDDDDLLSCIRAGAVGYVPSDVGPASLRKVVEAVISGEAALPRSMLLALIRELQATTPGGGNLTQRERQVLGMLQRGRSTVAIADRLGISPVTVRRHISTARKKARVEGRLKQAADGPARRATSEQSATAGGDQPTSSGDRSARITSET